MNSDVTFTYQFHDRGARSYLRPMIRGSGATGSSQKTNGYRLEFRSDSATVKLQKVVNGTSGPLDEFTYTMDTAPHRVLFRTLGSTVQAKVWPAGTDEPAAWSLEATDGSVTAPGVFQLSHNYSSGAHAVTFNDLAIFNTVPGPDGTTYMALEDRGDLVCVPYVGVVPSGVSAYGIGGGEICYKSKPPFRSCYEDIVEDVKYATISIGLTRNADGKIAGRLKYGFVETELGMAKGAYQWAFYSHKSYKDKNRYAPDKQIAGGGERQGPGYGFHNSGGPVDPTVDKFYSAENQADHDDPGGTIFTELTCKTNA
jgi:hypothetical protein